ncbi:MAG: shikimate kinase [Clostridiales bacterium]|uniref:shikimate kinase n=1 Tax=Clostridium sp. N3C TaxID=1776758 RepID=UPI00092E045E|nr:shikimate kinase [Clostridium sp. N3C]NLZ49535.1 shikimate kinase [Clostridiales bacterium]SCN23174.1 Shikimate kinase 2 [Clostridium sp. N3C]
MNIVLIGMPGAGKSTLGVLLAKALGKAFVDTDIVIQQNEGMKLYEIIERYGLEEFLRIEERNILELKITNSIIATGGSVVYGNEAMEHLKRNGLIVYLKLDYEEIERRLKDITTRGIAMDKETSLRELYNQRIFLYEKYADLIIDCNNKSIEKLVEEIVKSTKDY